jgi:hypothetical protein
MISSSAVLVVSGVVCLLISGYASYRMIPREGRPAPPWMNGESGETAMALGQFILLIAGIALVAKGLL